MNPQLNTTCNQFVFRSSIRRVAGAEYVDTIRATLDETTAEAMLTGSLDQVRTSRAARAYSEANLIKVPYDPQRTIYLSLDAVSSRLGTGPRGRSSILL